MKHHFLVNSDLPVMTSQREPNGFVDVMILRTVTSDCSSHEVLRTAIDIANMSALCIYSLLYLSLII
jgi:hypothetical protein